MVCVAGIPRGGTTPPQGTWRLLATALSWEASRRTLREYLLGAARHDANYNIALSRQHLARKIAADDSDGTPGRVKDTAVGEGMASFIASADRYRQAPENSAKNLYLARRNVVVEGDSGFYVQRVQRQCLAEMLRVAANLVKVVVCAGAKVVVRAFGENLEKPPL